MGDKPRWPTINEISESVGGSEMLEPLKNKARNFGNKLATWLFILMVLGIYGAVCHFSFPLVHPTKPVSYKNAQAYFHQMHDDFLGEVMAESPDVCKDDNKMTLACYYLHKGSHGLISQAKGQQQ